MVIIGSARLDENGKIKGGKVGDQKQSTTPDYKGEVSLQNFYLHSKGWYILRPKKIEHANKIALKMKTACNNPNIGYNQSNRYGILKYGVGTLVKTETDCSSLVRECVKEATGIDSGDFNTGTECSVLGKTGLFESKKEYKSGMDLYTGDILVTKTKGHTVVVVEGKERKSTTRVTYYPKYTGSVSSIVSALLAIGEKDTSFTHRSKIAEANGIKNYKGTAGQNSKMLNLLREGKLIHE